jgi:hypothetical protein
VATRRGEAARRLCRAPPPTPAPALRPDPPPRRPPRPSAPSLTLSLRLASAPALSSDSTQGAWPLQAAQCSAVCLDCQDAAAAPHTHAGERRRAGRAGGGCLRRMRPPSPHPAPHPPPQPGLHARRAAEGRQPAAGRRRGAAAEGRSGASGAPPARGAAGAAARSLPRAPPNPPQHPSPPRRSRAAAHIALGIRVGALGDEVLEAAELAVASRLHEGRVAVLRRRGGGATRGQRRRRGAGHRGRRAARAEGEGAEGAGGRLAGRRSRCLWP